MYFELGQEIFKVQSQVQVSITFKYKYNLSSSVMTLVKNVNDHYQLLVQLHSIIVQSTPKWN